LRHVWLPWALYMIGGLVWFLVAEFWAIFDRRTSGDTLSEVIWALHVPPVIWFVGAGLIIGLIAWLVPHFLSGGKWGI